MTTHVQMVVDIETLGWRDSCVITRLAITPFRFDEGKLSFETLLDRTLYVALNQQEQIDMGRTVDPKTIDWWNTHSEELKAESMYPTDNDLSLSEMYDTLKAFLKRWKYDHFHSFLFARNHGFECFKLQTLNEQVFPDEPKQVLNNWNWHECKDWNYILSGGETQKWVPKDKSKLPYNAHAANHDTAAEAYRLLQLWHGADDE